MPPPEKSLQHRIPGYDSDSSDDESERSAEASFRQRARRLYQSILQLLGPQWVEPSYHRFEQASAPPSGSRPGALIRPSSASGTQANVTHFRIEHIGAPTVRETFLQNGLCPTQGRDWVVQWSGPGLKDSLFSELGENQKINHFPMSTELTRKDRLWSNFSQMAKDFGQDFDFVPRSFCLPKEMREFLEEFEASKNSLWIVKPTASSQGKGIFILQDLKELPTDELTVVSHYVDNPLLIQGLKFDLRIYVLVTGYDPLRVYMYREGLVRFASLPYSTERKHLRDAYRHLTNYSINRSAENFVENSELLADNVGHKWSFSALNKHLKCTGVDATLMWNRIFDLVVKSLLGVAPSIANKARDVVGHRQGCFELYGFDVMVDSKLKPWLLEVNLSPSMSAESPLDWHIKSSLLRDTFNLVGVPKAGRSDVAEARARTRQTRHVQRHTGAGPPQALSTPLERLSTEELRTAAHALAENDRVRNFIRLHPTADSTERYAELLAYSGHLTSSQRLAQLLFPNKREDGPRRPSLSLGARLRRPVIVRSDTADSEATTTTTTSASSSNARAGNRDAAAVGPTARPPVAFTPTQPAGPCTNNTTDTSTNNTNNSSTSSTSTSLNANAAASPPASSENRQSLGCAGPGRELESEGGSTSSTNHCPRGLVPPERTSIGGKSATSSSSKFMPGGDPFCLDQRPARCQSAGRTSTSTAATGQVQHAARPSSGVCRDGWTGAPGSRLDVPAEDLTPQRQAPSPTELAPLFRWKRLDQKRQLGRSSPDQAWDTLKALGKSPASHLLAAEFLHRLATLAQALLEAPWKIILPNALGGRLVSLCSALKAKLAVPEMPKELLPVVVAKLATRYMDKLIAELLANSSKSDIDNEVDLTSPSAKDVAVASPNACNDDSTDPASPNSSNSRKHIKNASSADGPDREADQKHAEEESNENREGETGKSGAPNNLDQEPTSPSSDVSRGAALGVVAERLLAGAIGTTAPGRKALRSLSLIPNRTLEALLASFATIESHSAYALAAGLPKASVSSPSSGSHSWEGGGYNSGQRLSGPLRGSLRPQWPRRRPGSAARARNAAMQQNGILTDFDLLLDALTISTGEGRDARNLSLEEQCGEGSAQSAPRDDATTAAALPTSPVAAGGAAASLTSPTRAAPPSSSPTASPNPRSGVRPSTAPRGFRPSSSAPSGLHQQMGQTMVALARSVASMTAVGAGGAPSAAAPTATATLTTPSSVPAASGKAFGSTASRPASATSTALGARTTPYLVMSRSRSSSTAVGRSSSMTTTATRSSPCYTPMMGARTSSSGGLAATVPRPSAKASASDRRIGAGPQMRRAAASQGEGPSIMRTHSAPEGLMAPNLPTRRAVTPVSEKQSKEAQQQLQAYLEATKTRANRTLPVSASSKGSTEAPSSLTSGSSDNDTRTDGFDEEVQRIQVSGGPGGPIRISRSSAEGRRPSSANEASSLRRASTESLNAAVRRLDSTPFALPPGAGSHAQRRPSKNPGAPPTLRPSSALAAPKRRDKPGSDPEHLMPLDADIEL